MDCLVDQPASVAAARALQTDAGPAVTVTALHAIGHYMAAAVVAKALGLVPPVCPRPSPAARSAQAAV